MSNNRKTNYKKMYDNKTEEVRGRRVEAKPADETTPVEVKEEALTAINKTAGKVTVRLLNVRVAPQPKADVIEEIKEDSEVSIDLKTSTEDWYAVTTETGKKGFCMKKFIAVC